MYKKFKNKKGEILKIWHDEDFSNPLEYEDFVTYYTWHNRSSSIQPNNFKDAEEWYDSIMGEGAFNRQRNSSLQEKKGVVAFAFDICKNLSKAKKVAFPILSHEHSDIRYYLGTSIDYWEGSIAGFAFIDKSKVYEEFGVKKITSQIVEKVKSIVERQLKAYTDCVNGYVYGFTLYNKDGEEIDSCGGFFGYEKDEDMLKDMLQYASTKDETFVEI